MDYEQKYKEANDKVAARFGVNVAKEIFTDLYESEDEKIRNAAIAFVNGCKSFGYHLGISREDVITWLEKQGEQKETHSGFKEQEDIAGRDYIPINWDDTIAWLKKQDEQKPTNIFGKK